MNATKQNIRKKQVATYEEIKKVLTEAHKKSWGLEGIESNYKVKGGGVGVWCIFLRVRVDWWRDCWIRGGKFFRYGVCGIFLRVTIEWGWDGRIREGGESER